MRLVCVEDRMGLTVISQYDSRAMGEDPVDPQAAGLMGLTIKLVNR